VVVCFRALSEDLLVRGLAAPIHIHPTTAAMIATFIDAKIRMRILASLFTFFFVRSR
jgi:hypothetical protein